MQHGPLGVHHLRIGRDAGARMVGHQAPAFRGLVIDVGGQHHGLVQAVGQHHLDLLDHAVHSVVEQVEVMLPDGLHQAVVLATNVYHKTPEGWRLVAHHASPGVAPDAQVVDAQRPVLH